MYAIRSYYALDTRTLGAILDTLLPADALSPSATDVGVDRDVLDFIARDDLLTQLFTRITSYNVCYTKLLRRSYTGRNRATERKRLRKVLTHSRRPYIKGGL